MVPRKTTRELEESTSDSGSSEAKVAAAPYEEIKHVHFIEIPAVKQEKIVNLSSFRAARQLLSTKLSSKRRVFHI